MSYHVDGDDFPERTWLLVRVLPGDTPRAIRLRSALKALLRQYRVKVEVVTGLGPGGIDASAPVDGSAKGEIVRPGQS